MFCCFNKSVICLSILSVFNIYTIIYSKLVLNLNEFLSSAEHKCYFEEFVKQTVAGSTVTSIVFVFPTVKVNVDPVTVWLPAFFKISSFVFSARNKLI